LENVEKKGSHHKLAELLKNVREEHSAPILPKRPAGLCEEIKL
jgi:hypothetical protein